MQIKERVIAGKTMRLETGRVARQSNGSVLVTLGETTVIATVNAAKEPREDIDFFPLQVEYREKHYAGGKIPGGFFKREARPAEHEVLTSRVTDRPLRPLFPKGYKNEVQVMITVLQSDGENMPDVLAGVGASAALMCSTIPWNGPIATVRVGRVNNELIINPPRSQIDNCDLELIVSGNDETIVMVEGEANEQSEKTVVESLKFAHDYIRNIIDLEKELFDAVQVEKLPEPEAVLNSKLEAAVGGKLGSKINDIISIKEKQDQSDAKEELKKGILEDLKEDFPEQENEINSIIEDCFRTSIREMILTKGSRTDGRKTNEIRDITIDPNFLSRVHGSTLFTRGETQAIVVTTLGTKRDEMIIDNMDEDYNEDSNSLYNPHPYYQ
jgi:polyribonucleotide nucleotidyltransferase